MIVSFADKLTAAIFSGHLPRKGISPRLAAEALAKMQQLHAAAALSIFARRRETASRR